MNDGFNKQRPDKLSLIVFSQRFDKVHYALVLASATAAMSTPVTLFFTMHATKALVGTGWRKMPAEGFADGGEMDDAFRERGVGDFETLINACSELGVKFMVCEMGLKALEIKREDLRDDIDMETGGVVTFMNDASNQGSIIFI